MPENSLYDFHQQMVSVSKWPSGKTLCFVCYHAATRTCESIPTHHLASLYKLDPINEMASHVGLSYEQRPNLTRRPRMDHIAGADLHKRVTQLVLLREGRPPSQARFANDRAIVEGALTRLPAGTTIAVESTASWWWFVDTARRLGHQVVLLHPKLTKAIATARLKSDKVDAVMLARLLKADLLPMVWIPAERERHIRELLAHRGRVVRTRTAVINELHALYSKRNLEVPRYRWHRQAPEPWQPEALGGYGPQIVHENVALLKALHEQIRGLDDAL